MRQGVGADVRADVQHDAARPGELEQAPAGRRARTGPDTAPAATPFTNVEPTSGRPRRRHDTSGCCSVPPVAAVPCTHAGTAQRATAIFRAVDNPNPRHTNLIRRAANASCAGRASRGASAGCSSCRTCARGTGSDVDDFQIQFRGAEQQVEIAERIEVAEIGAVGGDAS